MTTISAISKDEIIADLENRIGQLERALGVHVIYSQELGLTKAESSVVGLLEKRPPSAAMSSEQILEALPIFQKGGPDYRDSNLTSVYICKIRKKLERHGIKIITLWGQGYYLDDESKEKLQAFKLWESKEGTNADA
jgi:DNA-binding response OmpR family regulator